MQSLHTLRHAFQITPWQTFAGIVAVVALIMGGGLLLYPGVYSISKGYAVLAHLVPNAKALGGAAVLAALTVLLAIHRPAGLYALMGVFLFLSLLAVTSFLAVRLSGGTFVYGAFALLAFYGFIRSGGIRRRP